MRIAHVVSTYPPYRGGQGNVARELAERTAARGHEVVVVTPRRGIRNQESGIRNPEHRDSRFEIRDSRPWARFGNAAWCPGIRRALVGLQPDVVHLHWPFIGGIAPVIAWRKHDSSRTPLVETSPRDLSPFRTKRRKELSVRGLVVQYHMDLVGSGWRGAVFAAYQRRTLPRMFATADRVVVSSLDYARHGALAPFIEELGERLVEIPLGVDAQRFSSQPHPPAPPLPEEGGEAKKDFSTSHRDGSPPAREGARGGGSGERLVPAGASGGGVGTSRLTPHASRLVVLFVGGLDRAHAFKGLPVLLEAIGKRGQAPFPMGPDPFFLRIVGDGDLRSRYEQLTRQLGVADRVEFLGSVTDDVLPSIYQSADVLVLPSTSRSEAFGVVLLEAMASGLSVIASDLPGVRTVVADGETGFLVPSGDAASLAQRMRMLAGDPTLRRRMGDVARKRIEERYRWDTVVGHWQEMYQSLWRRM